MNDIITGDRSTLTLENYEAVSIVKYSLRRRNVKAVDTKPTPQTCTVIHSAHASYKEHLSSKREISSLKSNTCSNSNARQLPTIDIQVSTSLGSSNSKNRNSVKLIDKNVTNLIEQATKNWPASPTNFSSKKCKPTIKQQVFS